MLVVLKMGSKEHQYNIEEAFTRWTESVSPFKQNISDWLSKDRNGNVVRDPNRKMVDLLDNLKEAKNNIPNSDLDDLTKTRINLDSLNSGNFTNLNGAVDSLDNEFRKRANKIAEEEVKEIDNIKAFPQLKNKEEELKDIGDFSVEAQTKVGREIIERRAEISETLQVAKAEKEREKIEMRREEALTGITKKVIIDRGFRTTSSFAGEYDITEEQAEQRLRELDVNVEDGRIIVTLAERRARFE